MKPPVLVAGVVVILVAGAGVAWSTQDGEDQRRSGPTCNGLPADEVDGGAGAQGTAGADVVVLVTDTKRVSYLGRGGDDTICVAEGAKAAYIEGGTGHDYISAPVSERPTNDEDVLLFGGPGNDELIGSDFRDVVEGGPGDDIVSGGGGHDYLVGDGIPRDGAFRSPFVDGADTVDGGPGNDMIRSSVAGDDGVSAADVLEGGEGRDLLEFTESRAGLVLRTEDRTATAVDGATEDADRFSGFERYRGSLEDDVLLGGPGPDNLDGGFGRDRVVGGGGADRLGTAHGVVIGGAGNDTFVEVANGPRVRAWMGRGNDRVNLLSGRHFVHAGPGDDSVLVNRLEGTHDVDGGSGTDALVTRDCAPSDTGTVVTCGRSTTSYTSIETRRHRRD